MKGVGILLMAAFEPGGGIWLGIVGLCCIVLRGVFLIQMVRVSLA